MENQAFSVSSPIGDQKEGELYLEYRLLSLRKCIVIHLLRGYIWEKHELIPSISVSLHVKLLYLIIPKPHIC